MAAIVYPQARNFEEAADGPGPHPPIRRARAIPAAERVKMGPPGSDGPKKAYCDFGVIPFALLCPNRARPPTSIADVPQEARASHLHKKP